MTGLAGPRSDLAGIARLERRTLVASIVVSAAFGVLGIAWGLAARSQMILFDGIYALLGIVLSWLAVRAVDVAQRGPTRRYPFGRESLTPLVIGIQGLALLVIIVYASIEAVSTIRLGGSEVVPGWAAIYAVISAIGSTVFLVWIHRRAERSELIAAERSQWLAGAALGAGMVVGFGVMWALQDTSYAERSRYLDPAMVIVTCAVLTPTPIRMIRDGLRELLEGTPAPDVQEPVLEIVELVRREFDLDQPRVRMTKTGRKLYVEIDLVVHPDMRVGDADRARRALIDHLSALPQDTWLNVDLTADARLLE